MAGTLEGWLQAGLLAAGNHLMAARPHAVSRPRSHCAPVAWRPQIMIGVRKLLVDEAAWQAEWSARPAQPNPDSGGNAPLLIADRQSRAKPAAPIVLHVYASGGVNAGCTRRWQKIVSICSGDSGISRSRVPAAPQTRRWSDHW